MKLFVNLVKLGLCALGLCVTSSIDIYCARSIDVLLTMDKPMVELSVIGGLWSTLAVVAALGAIACTLLIANLTCKVAGWRWPGAGE